MLSVLRSLNLKILSLQSLIVLSICLYYFVGMQVSTVENIDPVFLSAYKVTFIGGILGLFSIYFALHHRMIVGRLKNRKSLSVLALWLILIILLKQPSLIFLLIIALVFYRQDYKKMTGYLFVWLSLLFISSATLASLGLISSGEMLKYNLLVDSSEYASVTALGMGNPNTAMAYLLGIIMSGAFIFYDTKYKNKYGIAALMIALLVFSLVGSRTGLLSALIFLVLYLIDFRRFTSILRASIPLLAVSLIAVSIFIGLRFGASDNVVNNFLTTRPYQWNLRLEDGALMNVIGNSDNFTTVAGDYTERYPLDNQFVYLLARSGWIAIIIVVLFYSSASRKIRSPVVIYMVVVSLFQAFVESLMFTAVVNMSMLFILSTLVLDDSKRSIMNRRYGD